MEFFFHNTIPRLRRFFAPADMPEGGVMEIMAHIFLKLGNTRVKGGGLHGAILLQYGNCVRLWRNSGSVRDETQAVAGGHRSLFL
jgi:hypothetical protein